MMILTQRESVAILCDIKGLQMAMYLSTVNAVMVRTDAYEVISTKSDFSMQNSFPNLQGYDSHIE